MTKGQRGGSKPKLPEGFKRQTTTIHLSSYISSWIKNNAKIAKVSRSKLIEKIMVEALALYKDTHWPLPRPTTVKRKSITLRFSPCSINAIKAHKAKIENAGSDQRSVSSYIESALGAHMQAEKLALKEAEANKKDSAKAL